MELFKGQSLLEFTERFKTDLDCEEYLASIKWEKVYCCRKCGHTKYQVRKDFSRTCNICSDEISRQTAHYFMQKVREAMKSSESHKMNDREQVDEFTIGGKEEGKQGRSYDTKKKKVLCAMELTDRGKVKRFYALKIPDFSSKKQLIL